MISSYDRTGGNDDGFSGKYSFVRKEGDGLVLADLKGPGVITRIWTPTPTDDPIEFYFDGEAKPRIRTTFRKLFTSGEAPFLAPLAGLGGGGFYSYALLPYKQSCRVVVRGPKVQFYQINYGTYAPDTAIASYQPNDPEYAQQLQSGQKLLSATGQDMTPFLSPATSVQTSRAVRQLLPGQTVTLFRSRQPGRLVGLRMGPASAFAGKDRAVLLRVFYDGDTEPAILGPVGDLFGYSWGEPATRSLLLGTANNTNYWYLPMPFDRSVRVELVSETTAGQPITVQAEVLHTGEPRRANEGKLYALWRRENPTQVGTPFPFVVTQGRGHVAGILLQAQGDTPGNTLFFEGDEQVTSDGELVAHGTGSEDFFNGGWYDVPGRWDRRFSLPLSGSLDYKKSLGRTGAYRFFLGDAFSYQRSLQFTIEHAPTGNATPTDYAGTAFLYSQERPTVRFIVPPLAQRRINDPSQLVFVPGWSMPVRSFPMRNATLAKKTEKIGQEEVRYLSLTATKDDVFGRHSLGLGCDVPTAGRYRVLLEALHGPQAASLQLFRNETAVGQPAQLRATERRKSKLLDMGVLDLTAGENEVFFKLGAIGPDVTQSADLVRVVLERVAEP